MSSSATFTVLTVAESQKKQQIPRIQTPPLPTTKTRLVGSGDCHDFSSPMTNPTSLITASASLPPTCCPHCGEHPSPQDTTVAQQRIQELEAQVKRLTARTSEMPIDLNDDNESQTRTSTSSAADQPPRTPSQQQQHQHQQQSQSRFANFAAYFPSYRRGGSKGSNSSNTPPHTSHSANPTSSPPPPPSSSSQQVSYAYHQQGLVSSPVAESSPGDAELQTALNREQTLRKEAESQLSQANSELEELTAQLFSQANEMVAQERKARAKLEERVALLEKRDGDKRKRLDRLEKAIERVERVRALVELKQ